MKGMLFFISTLTICSLFSACTEAVPLYGKWADNRGDTLSFFDDGSFLAVINDPYTGNKRHMEGSFNVLANALSFSCNDGTQIVSEWDIRGNMLYLIWSNSYGDLIPLTLYKISN